MKILILSDSNSPHTVKWAKSIYNVSKEIAVFSIHQIDYSLYKDTPEIQLFGGKISREVQKGKENTYKKLMYLFSFFELRSLILNFKPDLVHAHYASSYGLLGVLSIFHPLVLSVWGTDIERFPNYSFIHKYLTRFILNRADVILATSLALSKETSKYVQKKIQITPFGIDLEKFIPDKNKFLFDDNTIVIGNIKSLEWTYGLEYLIKAFKIVKYRNPNISLGLLLVGRGSQEIKLKKLVEDLGLKNETIFTGYVNHEDIVKYFNTTDICVFPSIEESFGVSVLEASSCEKPVIVSDVGGLPEVVDNEITGLIVEKRNENELANAIEILIHDKELRIKLGKAGREKVFKEYNLNQSIEKMISIYSNLVESNG